MKNMKHLAAICLLILAFVPLYGTEPEQITVPLSDPSRPGLVSVNHYKGSIRVTGYDGNGIVVTARYRNAGSNGGMKRIAGPALKLSATEKDNVVFVSVNSFRKTIDLDILVPKNFSLKLSTEDNGKIIVGNVNGVFELNNNNGDVRLLDVSGSAIVSTIDGNILADFRRVDSELPMAFTTIEGTIDLTFPGDSDICLKIKTEYGEVYSDFNINVDKRKSTVTRHKRSGSTKVTLDQWTYGKINNGGPEYLIKSMNGNIFIRRKK